MLLVSKARAVKEVPRQKQGEPDEVYRGRLEQRFCDIHHAYGKEAAHAFQKNYLMHLHGDHPKLKPIFDLIAKQRALREETDKLLHQLELSLLHRIDQGLPLSGTLEEAKRKKAEEDGLPAG